MVMMKYKKVTIVSEDKKYPGKLCIEKNEFVIQFSPKVIQPKPKKKK